MPHDSEYSCPKFSEYPCPKFGSEIVTTLVVMTLEVLVFVTPLVRATCGQHMVELVMVEPMRHRERVIVVEEAGENFAELFIRGTFGIYMHISLGEISILLGEISILLGEISRNFSLGGTFGGILYAYFRFWSRTVIK
jgi:hypothetical protein